MTKFTTTETEIFEFQKQINANAYILKSVGNGISSNSSTLQTYYLGVNSDIYILKSDQTAVNLNSYILVGKQDSLPSDSKILQTYSNSLTSYSESYLPVVNEGLTCDLWISIEYQNSMQSDFRIISPDLGEVFDEGWEEIAEEPEFEKRVTYRRHDLNYDNMTGDIDRSSYTEHSIYAEVQPLEITDKVIKSGEFKEGDAEIFIPARIIKDQDGNSIKPSFRPQLYDEITFRGITYKIEKITFERIGRHEVFADCMCKRMANQMPDKAWNDSYCEPYEQQGRPGKGWT